jgi:hypothetical protein
MAFEHLPVEAMPRRAVCRVAARLSRDRQRRHEPWGRTLTLGKCVRGGQSSKTVSPVVAFFSASRRDRGLLRQRSNPEGPRRRNSGSAARASSPAQGERGPCPDPPSGQGSRPGRRPVSGVAGTHNDAAAPGCHEAVPRRRASDAMWPRCRTMPAPTRPACVRTRRAVVKLVRPGLSPMRPCFGSNALSAIVRPLKRIIPANESVSDRRNVNMRNSDRYISTTYRAICAVEYRVAQFDTNNINDLDAQLRSPFI